MSEPDDLCGELLRAAGLPSAAGFERMDHGASGDIVFRIDGVTTLFAKVADPARRISRLELAREIAALQWVQGRAPAARPVWSGEVAGRPAMITEAVAGTPLHALPPEQAEAAAVAALTALVRLHALPIASCPFDERLGIKLTEATLRVRLGEIEIERLDPDNAGAPPEAILAELEARRPTSEDLAVTHGDASWPNFILQPDGAVALIDLGRFGVADRHQDLALFVRSAKRNFPDLDIEALLARRYPVAASPEALAYYRLLDELY